MAGPNLTGPGASLARRLDVPDLAGPLLFSAAGFALATLVTLAALRPDPLVPDGDNGPRARRGIRAALPHLHGRTLVAVLTIAISHAVMVAVMALTPVHMQHRGSGLQIIGLTISLDISGMYALSPVMGWASDRWGADRVVLSGQVVLLTALAVAGASAESGLWITVGLVLMGIGWSASVIAAQRCSRRPWPCASALVQGFSDLSMNLAVAAGGLLVGAVVALSGFATLNAAAVVLVVPVVVMVLSASRADAPRRAGHATRS